jgi:hypothetical protein
MVKGKTQERKKKKKTDKNVEIKYLQKRKTTVT